MPREAFPRLAQLELELATQPDDAVFAAYADWLENAGEELGAATYRYLAGRPGSSAVDQRLAVIACGVATWLLIRDVHHRFDPVALTDETTTFHALREAKELLAACAAHLANRRNRSPKLGPLHWAADETPGLPVRERVEEVWRALAGLQAFVQRPDDAAAARQAMGSARAACSWPEFRELLEVAVAGSLEPFLADKELPRVLKKAPRASDLALTWEGVSVLELRHVQLNNNSSGIAGRVFPVSRSAPDRSPHACLALLAAEQELGEEWSEMTAQERVAWLREDTTVLLPPWRSSSWFEVLGVLSEMVANNYGRRAAALPGEVQVGEAGGLSLAAALRPLGRFRGGAANELVTVLRFEHAWWLLQLRL